MSRRIAAAALMALALTSADQASAQPTAAIDQTAFTFVDWLSTGRAGTETVGTGAVDTRDVVFYIKEKSVGGFQSWYLFFDPAGTQFVSGLITFETAILQVFATTSEVLTSGATYQLDAGVMYGSVANTGLEDNDGLGFLGNVLDIEWTASEPGDHIRVLTAADPNIMVPEPSSFALVAAGFAGLGLLSRRRRKA